MLIIAVFIFFKLTNSASQQIAVHPDNVCMAVVTIPSGVSENEFTSKKSDVQSK